MQQPSRGLFLVVVVALFAAAALVPQLLTADHVRVERMAGDFADGDYASLGGKLLAPSAARPLANGDLELTDRRGDVHVVPAANLPLRYEVGEDRELVTLVGLGEADEHGILLAPPSRVHLRLDDRAWSIVEVDLDAR